MIFLKQIEYGSNEYQMTLELRNRVMRIPLGLSIFDEDFSFERNCMIVGAFTNNGLIGAGTMSNSEKQFKLEYLCVDTSIQSKGTGGMMLKWLEENAKKQGAEKIILDARVSAQKFYEHHGYQCVGDVFLLSYAPVEHILMEKKI